MSVDFSWRMDEDVGPLPEGEVPEKKEPSWRGRVRRALLVLIIVLVAGGALGYGYYRYRERQLIAEFQRVVDADLSLFLNGHDRYTAFIDTERWDVKQSNPSFVAFYGVNRFPFFPPSFSFSMRVTRVELHGDIAWVWVEWEEDRGRYWRVHFYRRVKGVWKRTTPDERFWGEAQTEETPFLRWKFHARDAPYVRSLVPWGDEVAARVVGDLGLQEVSPVTIEFATTYTPNPQSDRRRIVLLSPVLARVREDGYVDEMWRLFIVGMYMNQVTCPPSSPVSLSPSVYYTFCDAITYWETTQIVGPPWKILPAYPAPQIDVRNLPTLDDLDGALRYRPGSSGGPPDISNPFPYMYMLVDFIVHRYGTNALGGILQHAQDVLSVQGVLRAALGPDFDVQTFEREWHAYVRAHKDMFNEEQ